MSIDNGTTIYNGLKPMKLHRHYVRKSREKKNREANLLIIEAVIKREKWHNRPKCSGNLKRRMRGGTIAVCGRRAVLAQAEGRRND